MFSADKLVSCSFEFVGLAMDVCRQPAYTACCNVVARVSDEGVLAVIGGRVRLQRMEAV
jgi:hypothetical protein